MLLDIDFRIALESENLNREPAIRQELLRNEGYGNSLAERGINRLFDFIEEIVVLYPIGSTTKNHATDFV